MSYFLHNSKTNVSVELSQQYIIVVDREDYQWEYC